MERVKLSDTLEMSRLIYGMWRLGDDQDTSPAHVERKIQLCLDQGVTTFDQADIYGDYRAEDVLGGILKINPSLRDKMEIVTKCGIIAPCGRYAHVPVKHYDTSRAHIERSVDFSLANMGIEAIDLLLIHRPDPFMDHHETGAALDDLIKHGKVKNIGVSNFRPWDWDLLQSAMTNKLVTNQIEISLSQISPFTNGDLAFHQKLGTKLMAWSPLGGGSLMSDRGELGNRMDALAASYGVDRAAVAIAFLLAHPANLLPILGTNNLKRIEQISQAQKVNLDRESWYRLYEAALGTEVP